MIGIIVVVMVAAIASCWVRVCLPPKGASELKGSLLRVDAQILVAGVVLLTAFMPVLSIGSLVSTTGSSPIVTVVLALEAVLCLALNKTRVTRRQLIWYTWETAVVATAVRGLL
jgi:hypothetical protein